MGFDIDRFPDVNHELICCICTGVLEDPIESPCRHVFCSDCIKTWLSTKKTCPSCRSAVRRRDLRPVVLMLKNIISKQRMYCDNKAKGCEEIVELEQLTGHVANCKFSEITCENEGCNVFVLRKDYNSHAEICPRKMVVCNKGCDVFMTLGEREGHNCIQALKSHFQMVTNELQARLSKLEEVVNRIPGADQALYSNFDQAYNASPSQSPSCQEVTPSYNSDQDDHDSDNRPRRRRSSSESLVTETSPRLAYRPRARGNEWRIVQNQWLRYPSHNNQDHYRGRRESRSRSRSPVHNYYVNRGRGRRGGYTDHGSFPNRNRLVAEASPSNTDTTNSITYSESDDDIL